MKLVALFWSLLGLALIALEYWTGILGPWVLLWPAITIVFILVNLNRT